MSTSRNIKVIKASVAEVFNAFATGEALERWLAPDGMTGKVHSFDFRPGGGYEMSLYYNEGEARSEGKTSGKEDRFTATFREITPNEKIVQVTEFDTNNDDFGGEMVMEVLFEPKDDDTIVKMSFSDIPKGVNPDDNKEGTRQSLEKLAKYVERK